MRLAVLADVHGNVLALQAVLADLARRNVDAVVNLGDCVSGPLWPRETLELLRSYSWPTVRGNHDRYVGAGRSGELGPSDLYAYQSLEEQDRAWLAGLPMMIELRPGCLAMHARPDFDDRYLVEDQWGDRLVQAAPKTVRARLGTLDAKLILTAHSHRPCSLKLPNGPWVVNPGSVGCPAYDDDSTDPPHISEQASPEACYAIVEHRADGLLIEALSIPYDFESAAERASLNRRPGWAHALRTGFMPRDGVRP